MIIKGGARAGAKQLAAHLQRTDTNEQVSVLELHSGIDDLAATFRDWQTLAEGTRGTKGLYHVNIDPDARYTMTPEQWTQAVDVLERELGLDGQPRAVVLHEKKGRQHIHVVWARTDIDTMTMRSDSQNYAAHERASQFLEQAFGHEAVPGKHAKRDREKQPEFPSADITHAEWQQAERTVLSIEGRRDQVAALHCASDNGTAFKTALEEAGYVLAQGDRRDFMLVDGAGESFSLGRQLKGVKAPALRTFMADVDLAALPTVAEAATQQRARQDAPAPMEAQTAPAVEMQSPPIEDLTPAPEARSSDLDPAVARALAERQAAEREKLTDWHHAELQKLDHVQDLEINEKLAHQTALHTAERDSLARAQRAAHSGIERFIQAMKNRLNPGRGADQLAARRAEWRQLNARQDREEADLKVLLEQNKADDIAALKERHAQQSREQAAAFEEEKRRYAEDAALADRLLQRVEDDRREQERRRAEGQAPPGRGK